MSESRLKAKTNNFTAFVAQIHKFVENRSMFIKESTK